MNVLALILARGGSKGVPRKNVRLLGGKPLMAWTIEAAKSATSVDAVQVVTDDAEIACIARDCQARVIAEPEVPDARSRMVSLEYALSHGRNTHREVIVDLHADCPFKTGEDIDACVRLLLDHRADSVISVCEMQQYHPARMKWIDEQGCIRDFLPEPADGLRQNLTPKACVRAGGLYVYKREMVDAGRLFGHNWSVAYVMPWERAVNIDTELDWMVAECLLSTVRN